METDPKMRDGIHEQPPTWPEPVEEQTALKLEINRLIWQHARPNMTLDEADKLSVEFWEKLVH